MLKLNLVHRLCPPHCFTLIKNYYVAPIVYFPAEEKPNRISDSGPFTAREKEISSFVNFPRNLEK